MVEGKILLPLALVVLGFQAAFCHVDSGLCKDNIFPLPCLISPCIVARCPKYPKAECRVDYCNCKAIFYFNGAKLTESQCNEGSGLCPGGSQPVYCYDRPCDVTSCPSYPSAICVDNYCGGCTADFFLYGVKLTKAQCGSCSGSLYPCGVRPCLTASCPKYPTAECRDDYCGGCNAHFYLNNVKLTKEQCHGSGGQCPDGRDPHHCYVSPCSVASCPAYPTAVCKDNYCGGCNAEFYLNGQKLSKQQCESNGCYFPRNSNKCAAKPCQYSTCPAYPGAECRDNYCYGCTAEWWFNGRKLTKKECEGSTCLNGRHPHNCAVAPCDTASCPNYPTAYCVNNYCGGCHADFYYQNKKLDPSECKSDPRCPPNSGKSGICNNECYSSSDCGSNRICCPEGCGLRCKKISSLPKCLYNSNGYPSCQDRCGEHWGCNGPRKSCCFNGYCNVCEKKPRPDVPKCKYLASGVSPRHCSDQCTSDAGCAYSKTCCFNGQCTICVKIQPSLPTCKASVYSSTSSAVHCNNACYSDAGCGYIEHCCFNGYCNKCELKKQLPKCKASLEPRLSFSPCSHDCDRNSQCGLYERCCFNGVCRKCELDVNPGNDVKKCSDVYYNSGTNLYSLCVHECSATKSCPRGKSCCFDGWCTRCIRDPIYMSG